MEGRFYRLSLLVDVPTLPSPDALWAYDRGGALLSDRVFFHETVHYWQQLCQPFLVSLAGEEWAQLRVLESLGNVTEPGPFQRRFQERRNPYELSARDLHEMLARFWEVVAFGPRTVIENDLQFRRRRVHRDYMEASRRERHALGAGDPSVWTPYDLTEALLVLGDTYTDPLREVVGDIGPQWPIVFPWLAHLSLCTDHPAATFPVFVATLGRRFNDVVADLASRDVVEQSEFFSWSINEICYPLLIAAVAVTAELPYTLLHHLVAHFTGGLASNPIHRLVVERQLLPAAAVLAGCKAVDDSVEAGGGKDAVQRLMRGMDILWGALATPGLMDSRRVILLAGLLPPAVRSASGQVLAVAEPYRQQALSSRERLKRLDILDHLLRLVARHQGRDEDEMLLETSLTVDRRRRRFADVVDVDTTHDPRKDFGSR